MPRFFIIFKDFLFGLFCFFALFCSIHAYGDDPLSSNKSANTKAKEAKTKIRSDIIDIKRKSQSVNFVGNVVIEKADSSFLSQKMTILYNEKENKKDSDQNLKKSSDSVKSKPSKKSSIKKIYTNEKVKIFSDEFVASGDSGYYEPANDIFVLEKNVIVNNGVSIAKGDKFIHHISTKRSNFVGQKQEAADKDKRVVIIIGDDAKDAKKSKEKQP